MVSPRKRQCQSTLIPTTTTNLQLVVNNNHSSSFSCSKRKQKANNVDKLSKTDLGTSVYSRLKDDVKQIKRYASELIHHERSTVELRPDGSIVITPHPRQLPNEVLSLIIGHLAQHPTALYQYAIVNKQFHAITIPLLWRNPTAVTDVKRRQFVEWIAHAPQQQLQTFGRHIRRLQICHLWANDVFRRLLPHIAGLEELAIYNNTNITDAVFRRALRLCQRLVFLKLGQTQLTQSSFTAIGQHCLQLRQLEWAIQRSQSPEWLALLLPCPLEKLAYTIRRLGQVHHTVLETLLQFDRLTCLSIGGTRYHLTAYANSLLLLASADNSLVTTKIAWPRLAELAFSDCSDIGDATLIGFIKLRPHLQCLRLELVKQLTDTSLDAMAQRLPQLTHLRLMLAENITSTGIRRFIRDSVSTNLASISLVDCSRMAPDHFPEVVCAMPMGEYHEDDHPEPIQIVLDQKAIQKIKHAERKTAMTTLANDHRG